MIHRRLEIAYADHQAHADVAEEDAARLLSYLAVHAEDRGKSALTRASRRAKPEGRVVVGGQVTILDAAHDVRRQPFVLENILVYLVAQLRREVEEPEALLLIELIVVDVVVIVWP